MKRTILTLMMFLALSLPFSGHLVAQEGENSVDSLKAVAVKLPHNAERLQMMQQIVQLTQLTPAAPAEARALMREAQLQCNDSVMCFAVAYIVNYLYNYDTSDNSLDSIRHWVDYGEPIARRCSYWKVYFEMKKTHICACIYADRFEYALDEAEKMEREAGELDNVDGLANAYWCKALVYYGSKRWKEAHAMLLEAHSLFSRQPSLTLKMSVLIQLLDYYTQNDRYADLKRYIDETQALFDAFIVQAPAMEFALNDQLMLLDCFRIYYYAYIHDFDRVEKSISLVQQRLPQMNTHSYRKIYAAARSYYSLQRKDYTEALRQNDSVQVMIVRYALQEDDRISAMVSRADILYEMGDYPQALGFYKRSQHLRDSLSIVISDMQMAEIKEMYHLERLQMRDEQLKEWVQTVVLVIMLGLVAICAYYLFHLRMLRRALRRSERETQEALRQSEEANEQKGRFLANMSHAIRTPLNSVVGISQLLATETDITDTDRTDYGDIIRTETEQLMYLVNSVLDLSRLEAGMTKWQMADCDMVQLCRDAVSSARMQNPNLKVDFHCTEEQCPVRTDYGRLMQLVVSTLAGPVTMSKEEAEVIFSVSVEQDMMRFAIAGSPLADSRNKGQDVSLRNSINLLTLKFFGGSYEAVEGTLKFSFPI